MFGGITRGVSGGWGGKEGGVKGRKRRKGRGEVGGRNGDGSKRGKSQRCYCGICYRFGGVTKGQNGWRENKEEFPPTRFVPGDRRQKERRKKKGKKG